MDISTNSSRELGPSGGESEREPARIVRTGGSAHLKLVNLALQGGGAHSAFAWGVLDRLIQEKRIAFDGISATSAGAINATVLVSGLVEGGRQGVKRVLAKLWRRIAHLGSLTPLQPSLADRLCGNQSLDASPAFMLFDLVIRLLSPYQFNPFNYNPLRRVLAETVDFGALRSGHCPVKLFLSATNVRTGKIKVFQNDEIGPEAVLASSCLPFIFQAVEIDGEHYWDGGYMGNPAIFPLIYGCESRDVVIVHINPLERARLPTTAGEIMNRINEISFNSSLMREMRAIAFVTKLIDDGKVGDNSLKRMLIHGIEGADVMAELSALNKLNTDWGNLTYLMELGRERAPTPGSRRISIGSERNRLSTFANSTSDRPGPNRVEAPVSGPNGRAAAIRRTQFTMIDYAPLLAVVPSAGLR
jgi:NTE family protein